jgi:hypothetical protein
MIGKIFFLVSVFLAVGLVGGVSNGALIAYYDFGTSSPSTANQGTAGTAADGVLVNNATIVDIDPDGRGYEYALQLNNTTGSVLADSSYMNITNGNDAWYDTAIPGGTFSPFTFAAWVRQDMSTTQTWSMIMSKGYESTFDLGTGTPYNDPDKAVFSYHNPIKAWSPLKSTVSVRNGYWNHVAVVKEGGEGGVCSLYINGVPQDSRQTWSSLAANNLDILIGAEPNRTAYQYGWNGMIDEVRIYDEALSQEEIMQLAQSSPDGCVCGFDADAGGPYQVDPGETVILDGSGSSGGEYGITMQWYIGGEYVGEVYSVTPMLSISYDTLVCDMGFSPGIYEVLATGSAYDFGCGRICWDYDVTTIEIGPAYSDINDDCKLDLSDYAILASQWLESPGAPSADIAPPPGGDGIVDIYDLGLLTESWLWGTP